MSAQTRPWWKDRVVYQIYPASFKDANGDGVGDLRGIIQKLDYIRDLGANTIWICPMYDSPQHDMGYDVRDYQNIYPPYGTLADMEELIREAHAKDIRVILDLVINHTSDEHPWFKESRSSKDNPKRDWYIWKPPRYDADGKRQPPTNWRSIFGGSAWEWDETTQEYYLHLFVRQQPDLNWENEETRKAIYQESMIYWLEKGIDGFRIDTVNLYSKPKKYEDAPIVDPTTYVQPAGEFYRDGPRMREFLSEMNKIFKKYDAMTVGECSSDNPERVISYVSAKENQLDMVFQFDVVDIGGGKLHRYDVEPRDWKLAQVKKAVMDTQTIITDTDAWTTVFLENHDQARSVSRFGNDSPEYRVRSAKLLALMLATLSGTLYIYQGQEIGMINIPESWSIDEYKDVDSSNYYKEVNERFGGDAKKLARAKAALQYLARDHSRTPMQWDDSAHGGFTDSPSTTPWMRVNDSAKDINVASQEKDQNSVLAFWRKMLKFRREHADLFVHGDFKVVDDGNENTFSFTKTLSKSSIGQAPSSALVVCNFSNEEQALSEILKGGKFHYLTGNVDDHKDKFEPWEARVYLSS